MATSKELMEYLCDQMAEAGVTARPMFGEYGLYCGGVYFASVCDNTLYLKPTPAGQALLPGCALQPPYPGAKPCLVVEEVENKALLCELARATAAALPKPRPRKKGRHEGR